MREPSLTRGLIVEDVVAMRAYLRILLTDTCIEIVDAANLKEARRFLRAQKGVDLDFVLLDLDLPDGNGLDLIPEINAATRIIALTADGGRESWLQCRGAGCEIMIDKSNELPRLKQILINTCGNEPSPASQKANSCYPYIEYLAETRVDLEKAIKS
jgi:CheY-like chemotaxis protein